MALWRSSSLTGGYCPINWERAIVMVDMDAFFASVEQLDHPRWRGRPVAITNGRRGTCIITCSYEARTFGVKTGMRLQQAYRLCPKLVQVPATPLRYAEISTTIMAVLAAICPDIEIFSVDEAFLDVSHCQLLHGSPARIARMAREQIQEATGLTCSAGVSGDKTTAKYAAKLNKPDGLMVIPPWEARAVLEDVPVTELCGIAHGIGNFLAQHGVYRCGQMQQLPISVLGQRFGNPGRRIWYMAQGLDPDQVHTTVAPPRSIGHGKVMPPNTTSIEVIKTYLWHMAHKVAQRLRKHDLQASRFYIALRTQYQGWLKTVETTAIACDDGQQICRLCERFLQRCWYGQGVCQVQITALNPHCERQIDLFQQPDLHRIAVNRVMDRVNNRYGALTLASARLLKRSDMPDVIAPSWRPEGHRKTV